MKNVCQNRKRFRRKGLLTTGRKNKKKKLKLSARTSICGSVRENFLCARQKSISGESAQRIF